MHAVTSGIRKNQAVTRRTRRQPVARGDNKL